MPFCPIMAIFTGGAPVNQTVRRGNKKEQDEEPVSASWCEHPFKDSHQAGEMLPGSVLGLVGLSSFPGHLL